jgi:hypothetical protein
MVMRHLLGTLLAIVLLLAGCGNDGGNDATNDAANDPGNTAGDSSGQATEGPIEPGEVVFVSESAVGGSVSTTATPLEDEQSVSEFAEQFEDPRMGARLAEEVAKIDVPDGDALVAAVVAVACDAPTEVSVEATPDGVEVSSPPVKTDKQCLVPVTTVALVTVPESSL